MNLVDQIDRPIFLAHGLPWRPDNLNLSPSTTVERTNSARMGTLTPSSTRSAALARLIMRITASGGCRRPIRGCCSCHERMLPPGRACSQVSRRTGHELCSRIGGTGSTASGRVARCVRRPTHVGTKSTPPTSGSSRPSSALRVCHRALGGALVGPPRPTRARDVCDALDDRPAWVGSPELAFRTSPTKYADMNLLSTSTPLW